MKTKIKNSQDKKWVAAQQLRDIQQELTDLLDRAEQIIKKNGTRQQYQSAKNYWLAHARIALTEEHEYLADKTDTLSGTIEEMEGEDDE